MASKRVHIVASVLCAACAIGGIALSSSSGQNQPDPVLQAAPAQPMRPDGRPKGVNASQPAAGRSMGWLFERPGKANGVAPTDEEWRQTSQLLSVLSPSRWQVFEQVLSKPHRADRAKRFLFSKYAEMHELEQFGPKRYEAKVEQVKLEDEIFKLDTDLKQAKSPGDVDQLKSRLRDKVSDWVTKDFDERETRLKQLQERLDRERMALEAERARTDEIIDRRVEVVHRSSEQFRAWAAGQPIEPGDSPFRRVKPGEAIPAPLPADSGPRRVGSESAPAAPRQ
jgi:hypothetical protein